MITADFHTHSFFSGDSEEPTENIVRAAYDRGMKTICLTEHMDYDYPEENFVLNTDKYMAELARVRELFKGKIEVLFGVELGLMDYLAPRLYDYTSKYDFDFIIGSSHLVDGEDPYYPEYFDRLGDKNGILRYFESILANISVYDNFDVYGHLDYAVRYSHAKNYSPADYRDITDEIIKKLVSMGKGIELNTAGLKYGLGWAHPHPDLLKRCRELGVEIVTVGSDGHKAEHIAWEFEAASDILKAAGFEYYAVFRHRKPEFVKIT